jgi:hypothetical protein
MSTDSKQSPLDDLENELRAHSRASLPPALGGRVLGAVHGELRRDRIREWASTFAWTAACAVLWLNLSWSVAQRIEEFRPERPEVCSLESIARDIQRVLPRTTGDKALSLAFTLRTAGNLDRCPEVRPHPVGWHDVGHFRRQP